MQQTTFACDALSYLPTLLARFGNASKALLVHGGRSYEESGAAEQISKLSDYLCYNEFVPAPGLPQLDDALRYYRNGGSPAVSCIVAVGGGRIIDTAKAISLGLSELTQFRADPSRRPQPARTIPLVAVPTTAGSGSEATRFAVTYIQGAKHSLEHPALLPVVALIDHRLMLRASARQLAVSGLDVVNHAIESLLSKRSTEESRGYARSALSLAVSALAALKRNPNEARIRQMAMAAHLAGEAINVTRTTIPHALSYYLSWTYDVPHGLATSLSMGRYLQAFGEALATDATHYLEPWRADYLFILFTLGGREPDEMPVRWRELLHILGLEAGLGELGIDRAELQDLKYWINEERFANAPISIPPDQASVLFDP
jgi:alcohol dehydrogenase